MSMNLNPYKVMKQEEKDLLLKDLSARLPYGVKFKGEYDEDLQEIYYIKDEEIYSRTYPHLPYWIEIIKPYLRSMSTMTEEEREELLNLLFDKEAKYFYIDEEGLIDGKTSYLMKDGLNYPSFCPINIVLYTDWLNENKFDYRGLIPLGLALEAPKNMYNYG